MLQRVIIAEDDLSLQAFFAKAFQNGFDVRVASDGHDVMMHLEQELPDVLLLDIGLPGVNGLEIMRYIREAEAALNNGVRVNIIVVTGDDLLENIPEVEQADMFLVKPVSIYQLVDLAESLGNSAA